MLWEFMGKYTAERYARFGDGEIWFGKQRVAFNFLPILAREFLANSGTKDWAYEASLFIAAKRQGYENVRQHFIPLVKNWTPIVKIGMEWMNLFGLGVFRTVKADNKAGFVLVTGAANFGVEMKAQRPGGDPVDFVIGGLAAGVMQYYSKTPIYAVETKCVVQKDVQECVVVAGNKDIVMDYVQKFSPDQIVYAKKAISSIEALEGELRARGGASWLV